MELATSSNADPAPLMPPISLETLRSIGRRRQRVALAMTVLTLCAYFSFILAVAIFKVSLSEQIIPGLSLAILAGVSSVAFVVVLTFGYVLWVNRVHDKAVSRLTQGGH
jgi:uncharacterized membrane protein (DUF485 family)